MSNAYGFAAQSVAVVLGTRPEIVKLAHIIRLLGDAPIYSGAVQKELVTPTGALIATSYASSFGPIPAIQN